MDRTRELVKALHIKGLNPEQIADSLNLTLGIVEDIVATEEGIMFSMTPPWLQEWEKEE